jgi:hypothetical protein
MNTDQYLKSVESFMNETKSKFKFALLQPVYHNGFRLNGVIGRRIYAEEPGDNSILYDIVLPGRDTRVLEGVGEYFISEGHLKEE